MRLLENKNIEYAAIRNHLPMMTIRMMMPMMALMMKVMILIMMTMTLMMTGDTLQNRCATEVTNPPKHPYRPQGGLISI